LLKVALNIKTGRHDIAEILLKVALNTIIKSNLNDGKIITAKENDKSKYNIII